jgi:hypothetical protein
VEFVKINPNWRPVGGELQKPASPNPNIQHSFSEVIRQQERLLTQAELQQQLRQIQSQGELLAKSMTIRDLRRYKEMIRQFLEDTVRRGIGMKEIRGWDRRGRSKRYKLLQQIDAALLSMADELLDSEEGRIKLLQTIGELRGLLVNLLY